MKEEQAIKEAAQTESEAARIAVQVQFFYFLFRNMCNMC